LQQGKGVNMDYKKYVSQNKIIRNTDIAKGFRPSCSNTYFLNSSNTLLGLVE
jgi:hypothetical protein